MAEYIEREAAIEVTCHNCSEKNICGGDCYDTDSLRSIPAADVAPVVRCKDCVYWQKPQILLDDGTYRDYLPGEYESGPLGLGVTVDVGINVGSFCAKYNTDHQNRIPQFMKPDDFCSKGYRAMDGGET